MQCQGCHHNNPDTNNYCERCGVRLEQRCPRCGSFCTAAASFCGQCGAELTQAVHLHQPAGERKQATVLFADIVASTGWIADLDAEDAVGLLRPVLAVMAESVRRFNGVVERFLGDGLKAVFGAPAAQESHAILACRAALAMREAVAALAFAPTIRIGLHSGEVVAGNLDSAPDQDAAGITVHIANRMEQFAEPNGICMSRECRALVSAYCDTAAIGAHPVKGLSEPIEIYRLMGLKPAIASEQFRGAELSPFYGRDAELSFLKSALTEAELGIPAVIGISAPPGAGKSRLCYEFGEWCRQKRVNVLEARALVYGHVTPLQPILEMLRAFFRVSPLDEAELARQKIDQHLEALDPSLLADLPRGLLHDFLGTANLEQSARRVDPSERQAKLQEIFHRMVKSAGRRPGVIIIEDLHWLDDASADFVETLVAAIAETKILVLVNFRTPYAADWMDQAVYRELPLGELASADIRRLVRSLIGDAREISELREQIAERSGGNPFFAEELIRSLADSGVLVGDRGRYGLAGSQSTPKLPASVEAVIGARVDRLQHSEKALLQIGATIGKEFPLALLRRLIPMRSAEIEDQLARLCGLELIQPQNVLGGRGFGFRHPLIQEVAYNMQLRARRRSLHAAVAAAIEEFEWGKVDEFAGLLAYHYEMADKPVEAARHLQRAAVWVGKTNSALALKHWKKVRLLLRDQAHTEQTDRMRAMASGQILNFGWREGMTAEEAKPFAEEALHYVRQGGDKMHEPIILGAYGRISAATGSADDYVALVRQALPLTSNDRDAGRTATVFGMLAQAYYLAGLLTDALTANDAALSSIAEQRDMDGNVTLGLNMAQILGFDVTHWVKCLRTRILVQLGRFGEAEEWLRSVFATGSSQDHPAILKFIPHSANVELAWWQNNAEAAQLHAARVREYAEQTTIPYVRVVAMDCAGLAKSASGDFVGAAVELREAVSFARSAKAGLEFESRLLSDLSDALYRGNEFKEAARIAEQAIEVARRRKHRVAECHASLILAAAHATDQSFTRDAAEALLHRAKELIHVSGATIFEPLLTNSRAKINGAARVDA